jgi:hypothetical protein
MPGGIFLIKDDKLVKMEEAAYDSEELLQKLLEDYPDLLAGDQINQDEPRRWLLISREMEISSEDSENRWSVDHLFLDQDGIPTLVEVKRSSDTRIRREVVGQMLDYAANAIIFWPIEKIQSKFEAHCQTKETDPDQEIQNLIGEEHDPEEFWQKVKTNLQAGKVRLVFVADVIPSELKRIVEFLNEQMDPAEVIAIEIKQFVGEGFKSMVPRVVGQTQQAMKKRGIQKKKKWDEESFMKVLQQREDKSEAIVAKRILAWAKSKNLRIWWGEGIKNGSFYPMFDYKNTTYWTVGIRTGFNQGYIEMEFGVFKSLPQFQEEKDRLELLNMINTIKGVNLSKEVIERYPSFKLHLLDNESEFKKFISTMDWILEKFKDKKRGTVHDFLTLSQFFSLWPGLARLHLIF